MSGKKVRSSRYGTGKRWQVRYRDPGGESRNRSFDKKVDAERFLVELSSQLLQGRYVDLRAGRMSFGEYANPWLERQILAPTSRVAVELRLRVHLFPTWSKTPLVEIRPATVQRWIRDLQDELAPSYVRLIVGTMGAVLSAAVEDGLLPSNPCKSASVRLPTVPVRRFRPWPASQSLEVLEAHPPRYRALIAVGAGCGLRQGECFGLRVHDVDFLRGELHVRQQIRLVGSALPEPALPKYGRTRTVPLPEWVANSLAAHIQQLQPLEGDRVSTPSLGGLLFYGRERKPLNRSYFNSHIWRPALASVGVATGRENGMHALRHACASTWLEHGVSIKAVSEYLGHADPGFTLRVYTHVMPSSGEKARKAIDAAFGEGVSPAEAASIAGAPLAHKSTPRVGH
ncbi:MAG: tyrosine-type recombinase/integrase [Mycobacteriales bacterium]